MEKMSDVMLVELQEVLVDLKEANERVHELGSTKPGDETYDEIYAECDGPDPGGMCQEQLTELVRVMRRHLHLLCSADARGVLAFADQPMEG